MKINSRRIATTLAAVSLAGLLSACGVGQKVDCVTMSNEVTKISQEFTTALSGAATDPKAIETASADAGAKLKALAGKYDGDLASAINDLANLFDGMKDPANAATSAGKIPDIQAKITKACS
ncbi:hypothetical protein ACIBG8_38495 [Nonomuraea sp. NPDC050556]|uniref:hypothetical protein n=1 Tax=Nonomuraea sp. NPDC050556 TaxID=3364369 RepID=UPI0037BB1AE9